MDVPEHATHTYNGISFVLQNKEIFKNIFINKITILILKASP